MQYPISSADNVDDQALSEDAELADAAAAASTLLARLTGELEVSKADQSVMITLRNAQEILGHLAGDSGPAPADRAMPMDDRLATMVIDVSDLIGYFSTNRLPTGIQRVQSELISSVLGTVKDDATQLCCFVERLGTWVTVESGPFLEICTMARSGGDPHDPRWRAAVERLRAAIDASAPIAFARGAVLVNVGTSWWLPNYFLYVRHAKITSGIRYVPLIYDLIPALTPEYCAVELVEEFIGWIIGVLSHADFFLTISEATRNDLLAFAERVGRSVAADRVAVVQLDADFRLTGLPARAAVSRRFDEPFVLFVSTIEQRKNQIGALDAWSTLIARHGAARVPRLVLVGKRGFKSDRIYARLETNENLRERVSILSGIEDGELQSLYRDCLFTLYPSFYEGWGLPVTESLCYGKVPLIADNSSLPEAGGPFALYFRTGSTADMVASVERLIMEDGYLRQREKVIRDGFRPRTWHEIAVDLSRKIEANLAAGVPGQWQVPTVGRNAYYPMSRNRATYVWRGIGSAEIFRHGLGWFNLDNGCCWTDVGGGELEMRFDQPGAGRLGFELICPPWLDVRYRIELVGHDSATVGLMSGGTAKWAFLDVPETIDGQPFRVRIATVILAQREAARNGDPRSLGLGLRGFFVFGTHATARIDFVEAAALGALPDFSFYRDRSLESVVLTRNG